MEIDYTKVYDIIFLGVSKSYGILSNGLKIKDAPCKIFFF